LIIEYDGSGDAAGSLSSASLSNVDNIGKSGSSNLISGRVGEVLDCPREGGEESRILFEALEDEKGWLEYLPSPSRANDAVVAGEIGAAKLTDFSGVKLLDGISGGSS
jgi:hypothetical protein